MSDLWRRGRDVSQAIDYTADQLPHAVLEKRMLVLALTTETYSKSSIEPTVWIKTSELHGSYRELGRMVDVARH
jgi:hypothetical protein